MGEFEATFEGPVKDVQAWADSQDAARGSSAVGAGVKAVLVMAGRDPNAVCVASVKLDDADASVSVRLVGASVSSAGFPQTQTPEDHAAAIDAGQAGAVEVPALEVVEPDPQVASSDASGVPSSGSSEEAGNG